MILAAGLGTRLRPYTLNRAKPLFPILNKPLLRLTISRIKQAGAAEIVVNAHHLRRQIKKALDNYLERTNRKVFLEYIMLFNIGAPSRERNLLCIFLFFS